MRGGVARGRIGCGVCEDWLGGVGWAGLGSIMFLTTVRCRALICSLFALAADLFRICEDIAVLPGR